GCRTFPARYVDVGDAIRVAPRPECACVFASARREDGEPLTTARRGAELPRETFVPALPPRARLGSREVDREELLAVLDDARARARLGPRAVVREGLPAGLADARARVERSDGDLARRAWTLAERIDGTAAQIDAHLAAAAASAARLARTHVAWRGEGDEVHL